MKVHGPESYVEDWLRQGVISTDQADRMLATLPATSHGNATRQTRASFVLEAAGYLGGTLIVVATLLIGAEYWSEIAESARLAATGAATGGLLLAGYLVATQTGPVAQRLWTVLWLASTGTASGFLALAADMTSTLADHVPLATTVGTAGYAVMIWAAHRNLAHQIVAMVALMIAAATAIGDLSSSASLPGLGAWIVAASWFGGGLADRLKPPRVVVPVAGAALVGSSLMTLPEDWGFGLAFVTLAGLVGVALWRRDLVLLGVAALGALQVLPAAALEWFPDSLAAPMALLVAGLLLVAAAVWTARRRRPPPD